jgi:hypothetical protein
MSDGTRQNLDRWEDLHVARLLFGLSPEEQVEYEALARTMPAETGDEFERLIAKIDVAGRIRRRCHHIFANRSAPKPSPRSCRLDKTPRRYRISPDHRLDR